MIILQTIGNVDLPGQGPRKLPAPKQYIAIVTVWAILDLVADMANASVIRAASAFAWLLVLGSLVLGTSGQRITSFLGDIAKLFPAQPPPQPQETLT